MSLLYNLIIHFYNFLIRLSSLFNPKAKLWIAGRKNIFERIRQEIPDGENTAWFHCASLGEFEQGRPVIEQFKKLYPKLKIVLTFFSPSGYKIRKNYKEADYIFYLPIDTPKNVRKFITLTKPVIAIFIKYEFWFNYLNYLNKMNIPVLVISSIFRPEQRFFKWYGGWFRKMLGNISYFFVQNQQSANLLKSINLNNFTVSGDTRFDRVYELAQKSKKFALIEKFAGGAEIFLAGSTWPPDEEIIKSLIERGINNLKFIFAPHEVHNDRINSLQNNLGNNVLRFSEANEKNISGAKILIIDNIGILSHLYQYAKIAYIGGGFGVGIHNILEAATFGKPVIFGPNYKKFQEARELINSGGAFSINRRDEFLDIVLQLIDNKDFYKNSSDVCKKYIEAKRGATGQILSRIGQEFRF